MAFLFWDETTSLAEGEPGDECAALSQAHTWLRASA
jgi:hypothetical protein